MNREASADGPIRRAAWIGLLGAASIGGSFIFACATPFAALAALAALHLRRGDAVVLVLGAWFANQFIGYAFLHYPQTWDSFAWGGSIGVGAVVGLIAAMIAERLARRTPFLVRAVASFGAAFIAYELSLFASTAFLPSGPDAFGFAVVSYIFVVNGAFFVGLLVLDAIGRALKLAPASCLTTLAQSA